jgi:anti-sigma regulatory factor (Ser/Thr protein kinase)
VPLGATRHARYDNHELVLDPGSVLVLYTDGLVERRGEPLEDSLGRLIATVRDGDEDLEHLGDALVDVLLPEGPGSDDAALLMARAMPLSDTLLARFPAEVESIPGLRRLLGRWLDETGATPRDIDDLTLAAAEAAANAIEHAYGLAPGVVELHAATAGADTVKVEISDFGNWRPPRGTHRGRGLLLMEGLTDDVEVVRTGDGTTVELTRRIGGEEAA